MKIQLNRIPTIQFLILGVGLLWASACSQSAVYRSGVSSIDSIIVTTGEGITWPEHSGIGRLATEEYIYQWDTDVRPDGQGLPVGSGHAGQGKLVYAAKCAACHGKTGIEGPYNRLVSQAKDSQEKTIGNYWPYSTTLFDYIRRAMPYTQPGSLTDEEVYQLTAFLLSANHIIDSTTILNAETLPNVTMPAQKHFIPDDRKGGPEVR